MLALRASILPKQWRQPTEFPGWPQLTMNPSIDAWEERRDDFVLLKIKGDDLSSSASCLIYDAKQHSTLLIENDDVAQRLMQKMLAAGVRVVMNDQFPRGQNELECLINKMLEAGKGAAEINKAIRDYERRTNIA